MVIGAIIFNVESSFTETGAGPPHMHGRSNEHTGSLGVFCLNDLGGIKRIFPGIASLGFNDDGSAGDTHVFNKIHYHLCFQLPFGDDVRRAARE